METPNNEKEVTEIRISERGTKGNKPDRLGIEKDNNVTIQRKHKQATTEGEQEQNDTMPKSLPIKIPIRPRSKALSTNSSSVISVKKTETDIQANDELDPLDEEEANLNTELLTLGLGPVKDKNNLQYLQQKLQEFKTAQNQEMVIAVQEEMKDTEHELRKKTQENELRKIQIDHRIKEIARKRRRVILKYQLVKDKLDLEEEQQSNQSHEDSSENDLEETVTKWMDQNVQASGNREEELNVVLQKAVDDAEKAKEQLAQFEDERRQQMVEMEQKRLQLIKQVNATSASVQATKKPRQGASNTTDLESTDSLMKKYFEMQIQMMGTGNTAPRANNSHFLARQSHAKDLPHFGGRPEEWPTFLAEFERSSSDCAFSNSENMSRLRKCLKGEALKTVQCLMVTPENLQKVLKTLKSRFGQPEHIIEAMINKAKSVPAFKEDRLDALIEFGTAVQNVTSSITALQKEEHLNNPQLLRELEFKLPVQLRMNWMRWLKANDQRKKDLIYFSEWLEEETEIACQLCPPKIESEDKRRPFDQQGRRRPNQNVFAVAKEEKAKNQGHQEQQKNWKPREKTCAFCSEIGHRVAQCKKFEKVDLEQKWKFVKEKQLCFGCLIYGHDSKACRSKKACGIEKCENVHNRLLHKAKPVAVNFEEEDLTGSEEAGVITHAASVDRDFHNCQIYPVRLQGPNGIICTYAMLDSGANVTLIQSNVAQRLGLQGPNRPLRFRGLHPIAEEPDSRCVALNIMPATGNEVFGMRNVRTTSNLPLPQQTIDLKSIGKWKHLRGLGIRGYEKAQPTILIGNDNFKIMVVREVREGPPNAPIAVRTYLGWTIATQGDLPDRTHHSFLCQKEDDELHQLVKDYFSTDSFGVKITSEPPRSKEDKRAQAIMDNTMIRVGNDKKRWETGLLWKSDDIQLPESKMTAMNRLKTVERKLDKNPGLAIQYYAKMQHYFDKGYARKLSSQEAQHQGPRTWYLPHFGTAKPSKPEKIRLVFDAAAKSYGICLNDVLLKGPDQVNPLPSVLFKFRQNIIGIIGDIKEMFHQVNIRKADQDSLRFLWRGADRTIEPEVYEMQVMVFGAACSPVCAQEAKNRNAREHAEVYPMASKAIIQKHYVDDYLDSLNSAEEASQLIKDVVHTHLQGGFEIVNFISNSKEVMDSLPEHLKSEVPKIIDPESDRMERVLGLNWDPNTDQFTFSSNFYRVDKDIVTGKKIPSKREALSLIMSIYDPLGFLAHLTIKARILLQETWRSEIGWDDKIPVQTHEKWLRWLEEVQNISSFRLPRCYSKDFFKSTSVQLHVFCDASEQAFAAVAYFRIKASDKFDVAFVAAKARVAPLKPLSMPRMELQAAVLGVRLANSIKEQHEKKPTETHFWTDSEIVYCWIGSDGRKCPQFVASRIGEVQESSDTKNWHWISTKLNVSDEATRDNCSTLWGPDSRWINGPDFLCLPEVDWPKRSTKEIVEGIDETQLEFKKFIGLVNTESPFIDVSKYSSWSSLRRTMSWIFRVTDNLKIKEKSKRILSESIHYWELQRAELWLLKQQQEISFSEEISKLKKGVELPKTNKLFKYDPCIRNGLLKVKGRLDEAENVRKDTKNPIILDSKDDLTKLIIRHYHEEAGHHGQERVANELRQLYCIPGLRSAVRRSWDHCQKCKNERAVPILPQMGLIPEIRLQSYVRPFTVTGLDYFGPIGVTVGRRHEKRYGALFTCMTSRAVHVEIAESLTTDSCIMAIRRFASQRGNPTKLYSDNGTNFRGADNELKAALKELDQDKIRDDMSNRMIEWHFIPPAAPHMGGSWERLVKSVKVAFYAILKERFPKQEVLYTLMAEAVHIVNSRPLTHVSLDPDDDEALTPNHFLIGRSSNMQPPGEFTEQDNCGRSQWRLAQVLTNQFWRRWVKEYLPTLTRRTKWLEKGQQVQINDIVLIADNNMTRNSWPMGKVVAVYPGRDGQVRVADVKTANGHIFKRPVAKICVLDVRKSDDNAAASSSGASMSASTEIK